MKKILILLTLLLSVGCSSLELGGGYADDGWTTEVTTTSKRNPNLGVRVSAGRERLPDKWAQLYGEYVDRYAFGPFYRVKLPHGFFVEPRFEVAYYNELGTPWEPEVGFRIGWQYKSFTVYGGGRHPLGNGDRHEAQGEYEHIPDGWKPEIGFNWTFNW